MKDKIVLSLSSAFGLGYMPKAPGTFGTLAALPLWWLWADLPIYIFIAIVAAFALFSIWISHLAEGIYGAHDVQRIVIDEVAGMLVTVIGVPFAWPQLLAAFALFRLFDATKPWPVGYIDDNVPGGLGVVVDDLAAGLMALAVMWGLYFAFGGWVWW
ncbi:phosphatidylglycerophosphatase A [Myxococcota bacterium]|nr:phosphatidylglycerophosphatase A [Myxococcota bacterium]